MYLPVCSDAWLCGMMRNAVHAILVAAIFVYHTAILTVFPISFLLLGVHVVLLTAMSQLGNYMYIEQPQTVLCWIDSKCK